MIRFVRLIVDDIPHLDSDSLRDIRAIIVLRDSEHRQPAYTIEREFSYNSQDVDSVSKVLQEMDTVKAIIQEEVKKYEKLGKAELSDDDDV